MRVGVMVGVEEGAESCGAAVVRSVGFSKARAANASSSRRKLPRPNRCPEVHFHPFIAMDCACWEPSKTG